MIFKRRPRPWRLLDTRQVFLIHLGKKREYRKALRLTASFVAMALGLK